MSAFHAAIVDRFIEDIEECARPKLASLRAVYGWSDEEANAIETMMWRVCQETALGMMVLCAESVEDAFNRLEAENKD